MRIARADTAAGRDGGRTRAVSDPRATMPGRGAYVCLGADGAPSPGCLARAVTRGGIARTLRCAVEIDAELLESGSR